MQAIARDELDAMVTTVDEFVTDVRFDEADTATLVHFWVEFDRFAAADGDDAIELDAILKKVVADSDLR